MRPKSRTHPEAAAELQESARWYDDEQAGVGDDFLSAAEAAVRGILDWPQAHRSPAGKISRWCEADT